MMNSTYDDQVTVWMWRFRRRDCTNEAESIKCFGTGVLLDPLAQRSVFHSPLNSNNEEDGADADIPGFLDPLGATIDSGRLKNSVLDSTWICAPYRKQAATLINTLELDSGKCHFLTDDNSEEFSDIPHFIPWSAKREQILQQFATPEVLNSKILGIAPSLSLKLADISDRAAERLEQLEDLTGSKKLANYSQEESICDIRDLKKKLLIAWESSKKVESIKIVVDISRILLSTVPPNFYPVQFVMVTDILDLFGRLVFERLRSKASKERIEMGLSVLPKTFETADIPEATKVTSRNWFCKIGDIVDLVPRFYVESSIIGCILFLDTDSLTANLYRLSGMASSISHPLIASYARVYICRIAMRLQPLNPAPHWKCFNDWMQSVPTQPVNIVLPAMEWILQCLAYKAVTYDDLLPVWKCCIAAEEGSLVFLALLNSVSPFYLNQHCEKICRTCMIDNALTNNELCIFGRRLLMCETPAKSRKAILKVVWNRALKMPCTKEFVECAAVWIEYAARYFTLSELSVMLDGLSRKIQSDKKHENFSDLLVRMIKQIVEYQKNVLDLLCMEHFSSLLNSVRIISHKTQCSLIILTALLLNYPLSFSTNFHLAYQVLDHCKNVYNSSYYDPSCQEEIGKNFCIVQCALDRFDLNSDPERALNFFVDCRSTLANCEKLLIYLVRRVCALGFLVARQTTKNEISASGRFLRACIAYSFVTAASLSNIASIDLFIETGLLALQANSLHQVDAIVKCSIEFIATCHSVSATAFRSVASYFLAFLLIVPDSPKKAPLYMFSAFLNAVSRYPWRNNPLEHTRLLIDCLYYLSASGQSKLPYHIKNVVSNDSIYAGSEELNEIMFEKVEVVIGNLEQIYNEYFSKYPLIAIELLETILSIGSVEKLSNLVLLLFSQPIVRTELMKRRQVIFEEIKLQARRKPALEPLISYISLNEKENR